jgi:hypothetical protein
MNPVTLVTPTVRRLAAKLPHDQKGTVVNGIALQPEDTKDRSNTEVAMTTITSPENAGKKDSTL